MLEIVFYGRGGQGCLVASKILAQTLFYAGKEVQTFPAFGGERRGAPVKAFLRIDDRPIRRRSLIYKPDHALVFDETLLDELPIVQEVEGGKSMVINTTKPPDQFGRIKVDRVVAVDAKAIARCLNLGTPAEPMINTIIVGAHLAVSRLADRDLLARAIQQKLPQNPELNWEGASRGFNCVASAETLV
jgi:2-oxoacid:acceptor oxidoreductase gamma subunit (pyruvate/2-ketoisovalerate family)